MNKSLPKFVIVGLLNSLFGYTVIIISYHITNNYYISNAIGYLLGLLLSFNLNSKITFKKKNKTNSNFHKFVMAFFISYSFNVIILSACIEINLFDLYISQAVALVSYTLILFLISKYYVFK